MFNLILIKKKKITALNHEIEDLKIELELKKQSITRKNGKINGLMRTIRKLEGENNRLSKQSLRREQHKRTN